MRSASISFCLVIAALLNFMLPPMPALAADKTLVSSVAEEYRDGVDMDIIRAIARELNADLNVDHAPFIRRLHMMRKGEIDFMVGLLKRPERESFIHFVSPPYKNRSDTVFFLRRKGAPVIRTYEDLYPLRIGTLLGAKYFPRFDNDSRLHKDAVSNGISNFKKLLAGRIDTAVFPESAGIDLIHEMQIKGRVAVADYRYVEEKQVYVGISKRSPLMASIGAVEAAIRGMIERGAITRIIADHYVSRGLPVPAM